MRSHWLVASLALFPDLAHAAWNPAEEPSTRGADSIALAAPSPTDPRLDGVLQRAFASERASTEALTGVPLASLVELRRGAIAGRPFAEYEQAYEGARVLGASVRVELDERGAVANVVARGLARSAAGAAWTIVSDDAAELARVSITEAEPERLWAAGARRALRVESNGRARGVWTVEVFDPLFPGDEWLATLDAASGELLELRRTALEALTGTVDGRGIASGPQTSSAPALGGVAHTSVTAFSGSTAFTRITTNACADDEVAISADGTRVAWVSRCDGDRELWTALRDGSGALQLTFNTADDRSPRLTSNGGRIVFVSNVDGDDELFVVNSDGTGLAQLTTNTARDQSPSISSDGTRVVWISNLDGDDEVFTTLVATPAPVQLTHDTTRDAAPVLSGDGTRIAWVSWSDGDADVMTMTAAGGSVVRVTSNSVDDVEPAITADGLRVAFASKLALEAQGAGDPSLGMQRAGAARLPHGGPVRRPNHDVFEAASDGSALRHLTYSFADERAPAYALAGGCIVYTTEEGGDLELAMADLATGSIVLLTANTVADRAPALSSSCSRGAFVSNDGDDEIWTWDLGAPGAFAATYTDAAGAYSLALPDGITTSVTATLDGRWATVRDLDPRWNEERANASATTPTAGVALHLNATGAEEGPTAQVTAYRHATATHDFVAGVLSRAPLALPAPLPMDTPLALRVDFPDAVANAFYSELRQDATFFVGAGAGRPNTAYDTVVMHEYGHFLHDRIGSIANVSPCSGPHALTEGLGDIVALFASGQPVIGADFFGAGAPIRDYSVATFTAPFGANGRQHDGKDCFVLSGAPEPHEHGEALAGFAWTLRASLGATLAENLVFGALATNPPSMQGFVDAVFVLSGTPAFGGTGSPSSSPYYVALRTAAAAHGFDAAPRPDYGGGPCGFGTCTGAEATHKVIGTEWLGLLVDSETTCEFPPNPDDDGLIVPGVVPPGMVLPLTVTLSVDPALKSTGRYGPPLPMPQLRERRVYLNAWLFVSDGAGGFTVTKVLGTGSMNPSMGPDSFETGPGGAPLNTVAFNPDTWPGSTKTYGFALLVPGVPADRMAFLRLRVDHGEDAGRIDTCLSASNYTGACGTARYGEVEDHQFLIHPGP
ncbi:MAG: PD40 domain-containing protein [Planctomycetes bacterium]|nr:PD40 domain-containing protein [Planctomycetota bacterium]